MTLAANGRAAARAALRGQTPPRPSFIPFVHGLAARLSQTSLAEMTRDATRLANALSRAQALFGYDAVMAGLDDTIAAEACGCEIGWQGERPNVRSHPWRAGTVPSVETIAARGRAPVIVEAVRRLKATLGDKAALLGVVAGPWTLAGDLYGPNFADDWNSGIQSPADCLAFAGRVSVALARLLGEAQVDGLLVMESGHLPQASPRWTALQGGYRTLWNVARFYNVPGILALREHGPESLGEMTVLGANALIPGRAGKDWPGAKAVIGRAVPNAALAGTPETVTLTVAELVTGARPSGWFLTTEWEVPADTPAENLHAAVRAARAIAST